MWEINALASSFLVLSQLFIRITFSEHPSLTVSLSEQANGVGLPLNIIVISVFPDL